VGDGGVLHGAVIGQQHGVEGAADSACGDFLDDFRLRHFRPDADEAQLTDLLVEGHLLHQCPDNVMGQDYAGDRPIWLKSWSDGKTNAGHEGAYRPCK
nr:hypothetical protein [Tanacetum cinerariifolium]